MTNWCSPRSLFSDRGSNGARRWPLCHDAPTRTISAPAFSNAGKPVQRVDGAGQFFEIVRAESQPRAR